MTKTDIFFIAWILTNFGLMGFALTNFIMSLDKSTGISNLISIPLGCIGFGGMLIIAAMAETDKSKNRS